MGMSSLLAACMQATDRAFPLRRLPAIQPMEKRNGKRKKTMRSLESCLMPLAVFREDILPPEQLQQKKALYGWYVMMRTGQKYLHGMSL